MFKVLSRNFYLAGLTMVLKVVITKALGNLGQKRSLYKTVRGEKEREPVFYWVWLPEQDSCASGLLLSLLTWTSASTA